MTPIRGIGRPEGGRYKVGKTIVPSVSEILHKHGSAEGLANWAARMAREGKDHNQERNRAADFGTSVHEAFEALLFGEDPALAVVGSLRGAGYEGDELDEMIGRTEGCIERLAAWIDKYKPKVLATEHPLVSATHMFGGTPDLVCEVNGRLTIVDIKTSSNVYPRYCWQLAGYGELWWENFGAYPTRYSVLWTGKDGKHFKPWVWGENDTRARELFLSMVRLHHMEPAAFAYFNSRRVVPMPRRKLKRTPKETK